MMDDSRINIAGLRMDNIGDFAEAVAEVVATRSLGEAALHSG